MKGMLDRKKRQEDGVVVEVDGVKLGSSASADAGAGGQPDLSGRGEGAARRAAASPFCASAALEVFVAVTHLSRRWRTRVESGTHRRWLDFIAGGHDTQHGAAGR